MSDFDRVKQSIDLADYIGRYAAMKRAGTVMQCCCPLPGHNDKTPSFQVKGDQWICRGKCGVGGDIFDFVQRYHGWTLAESLQELARYAGVTLEPLSPEAKQKQDHKDRLYALMEEATSYYHALLYTGGPFLNYLIKERGLSDETIKQARIGYAPGNLVLYKQMQQLGYTYQDLLDTGLIKPGDKRPYDTFSNRLMIPICDAKGRVVAFSGRAYSPDHGPKYLHNATNEIFHKSEIVHRMPVNPSKMGAEAFKTIIAVEGTIDPVSALNRGIYNVVSLLGKTLSEDQLNTLCKLGMQRLVFCLDRDESGRTALRTLTHKHVASLASKGIELYAMFAPHGKDPDDTFREKPELWQPAVDAARPVVDVLIDLELSALGANATAAQKSKMAGDLLPILKSDNPFAMDENFNILSSRTGIAVDALKNWAMPQMELLPKAAPASLPTKTTASSVPTMEEWVVHGLLVNEDEDWLTRANTRLMIASVDNLPYALAPLSIQDFTDAPTRRLTDLILKGESPADLYVDGKLELALRKPYERIATLDSIGKDYNLSFDFNVFVDAVYELRIARLIVDKDPSKSRECARAIACLRLAQEDLIEA